MKKPKRSVEWEAPEGSPSEDLAMQFDDQDEEIIDLEEIVETPKQAVVEDEGEDLEVEILDADEELDLTDLELDLENDLEEEEGSGTDFAADLSLSSLSSEAGELEQEVEVLEEDVPEEEAEPVVDLSQDSGSTSPVQVEEEPTVAAMPEETEPPATEPPAQTPSAEAFVAQIETRLLEVVKEVVEARLPEIVRTLLQEEIARLKEELGDE